MRLLALLRAYHTYDGHHHTAHSACIAPPSTELPDDVAASVEENRERERAAELRRQQDEVQNPVAVEVDDDDIDEAKVPRSWIKHSDDSAWTLRWTLTPPSHLQ